MKNKPILVVPGDTESIFFEIFLKSLKKIKIKNPIILISSIKMVKLNFKKFKIKKKIRLIDLNINKFRLDNKKINVININYTKNKNKQNQIKNENKYLLKSFDTAFKMIKKNLTNKFLNGPINKKKFLNRKYPGVTEYISNYFNEKKNRYVNIQ